MPLYIDLNVPWPEPHAPPPTGPLPDAPPLAVPEGQRPMLRNYGDVLYWLPEFSPFRYHDGPEGVRAVQEFGDSEPTERPLLRRLLGALAEPLTRVSDQLDRLPERLTAGNASDEWAVWCLRVAGFPAVADLPGWAARGLVRALNDLIPVGRAEGYLRLTEACFGRGTRTYSEDGSWAYRSTETPGGVRVTFAERLPDPSRQRAVRVEVQGDVPDWFVRQIARYRTAFFSLDLVVARSAGTPWVLSDAATLGSDLSLLN